LLPLAAVALVIACAVSRWRRYYAPAALALALVATLSVYLAQESGESLEERVDETELVEEHTQMGNTLLPWAIAVTVVSAAATALPYLEKRRPNLAGRTVTSVLLVGALVVGVGAVWTTVEVGHSGAKAAWDDVDQGG
jgi:DMSO reductase anchor subunit